MAELKKDIPEADINNKVKDLKKKEGTGVRELFGRMLDNAEITPSASVRDDLMKKLARREFVRFNPTRFNIYYLGLVVAAAITAGVLLLSGDNTVNESEIIPLTETGVSGNDHREIIQPLNEKRKTSDLRKTIVSQVSRKDTLQKNALKKEATGTREKTTTLPAGVKKSLSGNELFRQSPVDRRLQKKHSGNAIIISASVLSGCEPLKTHLSANVSPSDSCSWSFGDGGYSAKKEPDWIFDEEGEYKIILVVQHADGSTSTASQLIYVYPRPQGRFEISPEEPQIPDDEIRFLNYSTNATSYKWNFGDGTGSELFEPSHKYSRFGSYDVSLVLTTEHGCIDSVFMSNAFSGSGNFIEMPNAFIPNTDGPSGGFYSVKSDEAAQIFHPVFEGVSEYQLRIFSKLGLLLFESNDINVGWDGYFKGQLSNPGVYIWKIRGTYRNGEPFIMMGDVTLLKN